MAGPSRVLARLLPIDPDYAPFGWHWLRGLNAFPFGLYYPIIVSRSLSGLNERVTFRGDVPFQDAFVAAFRHVPAQLLCQRRRDHGVDGLGGRGSQPDAGASRAVAHRDPRRSVVRDGSLQHADHLAAEPCARHRGRLALEEREQRPAVDVVRRLGERAVSCAAGGRTRSARCATPSGAPSMRTARKPRVGCSPYRRRSSRTFSSTRSRTSCACFEIDPQRGRAMLQSLTDYMRSALPQLRDRDFTLAHGCAHARLRQRPADPHGRAAAGRVRRSRRRDDSQLAAHDGADPGRKRGQARAWARSARAAHCASRRACAARCSKSPSATTASACRSAPAAGTASPTRGCGRHGVRVARGARDRQPAGRGRARRDRAPVRGGRRRGECAVRTMELYGAPFGGAPRRRDRTDARRLAACVATAERPPLAHRRHGPARSINPTSSSTSSTSPTPPARLVVRDTCAR